MNVQKTQSRIYAKQKQKQTRKSFQKIESKEKNLKNATGNKTPYFSRSNDKNYAPLLINQVTRQARREQSEIFKVLLKEKTHQPTILYPVKLHFKSKEKYFLRQKRIEGLCCQETLTGVRLPY